jgi:predicted dehydrogenase
MTKPLKLAVIGVGHLGSAHARVCAMLETAELIAVCDTSETQGRAVAEKYNTRYVADYRELLDAVEAVSIATPTVNHHEVACAFLDQGIHALVEKPIARSLAEADEMIALAAARHVVLQVGHIERFNPAFVALQPHIHKPRFFEAHRMGIFTPRSLDIDVVMDLMVHELDIIATLVNSEVVSIAAVGIPILTPKVDLANARLEFANGCIANITASRVAGERLRKLRIFQPNEYYSLDYAEQQVGMCKLIPPAQPGQLPQIMAEPLAITKKEPLLAEIEAFVQAVQTQARPVVDGIDGRRALALALTALEKIYEHTQRVALK